VRASVPGEADLSELARLLWEADRWEFAAVPENGESTLPLEDLGAREAWCKRFATACPRDDEVVHLGPGP